MASSAREAFGDLREGLGQFGVVGLPGEFLGPVQGQVEVAAPVVDPADPPGRGLVLVEEGPGRTVEGVGEHLSPRVAGLAGQVLQAHGEGQELTEAVPAQVVLLDQLLDVLGRRAAGSGLEQAAAVDQRHDGEHLGRRAEFEDREQVGQVVTQHVAGDRDGVLAPADPLQREGDGLDRSLDLDVQAVGVVLGQVLLDLGDQVGVVGATSSPARTRSANRSPGPGTRRA